MNGKIIDVMLGFEDHGILTCYLTIELENGLCFGFGGYHFGAYSGTKDLPVNGYGTAYIQHLLDTIGVNDWSKLKGQYVRVKGDLTMGGRAEEIGNIMKDKWFNPKQLSESFNAQR